MKAKRADDLQARLVAAAVREGASGILEDPDDLPLHRAEADLLDDEGLPDVDKIAEAAHALASQRPHLARRRPTVPSTKVHAPSRRPSTSRPCCGRGLCRRRGWSCAYRRTT